MRELEQARDRVKAIRIPAALEVGNARGEFNQTKQLIERMEMDEWRMGCELESRRTHTGESESDDDADIVIDEAPPDPE